MRGADDDGGGGAMNKREPVDLGPPPLNRLAPDQVLAVEEIHDAEEDRDHGGYNNNNNNNNNSGNSSADNNSARGYAGRGHGSGRVHDLRTAAEYATPGHGFVLFQSRCEFLFLPSGDPRVRGLHDRVVAEASDPALGALGKMAEFHVGAGLVDTASRWWWKVPINIFSAAAFCLGLLRAATLALTIDYDDGAHCVEVDQKWNGITRKAQSALVSSIALFVLVGVLRARLILGGAGAWKLLRRQICFLYLSRPRLAVGFALGLVATVVSLSPLPALFIVSALVLFPVADAVLMLQRSRFFASLAAVGVLINYAVILVEIEVEKATCDRIDADRREYLNQRIVFGIGNVLYRVYVITLISAAYAKSARPHMPIAQEPRMPYSWTAGEEVSDQTVVLYSSCEFRVMTEGSDEHLLLSGAATAVTDGGEGGGGDMGQVGGDGAAGGSASGSGSMHVIRVRENSTTFSERPLAVCAWVATFCTVLRIAYIVVDTFDAGRPHLRCFERGSTRSAVRTALAVAMIAAFASVLVAGLRQWVHRTVRPWHSLLSYIGYLAWNRPIVPTLALVSLILSLAAGRPYPSPLAVVLILPLFDACVILIRNPGPAARATLWAIRAAFLSECITFIEFYFVDANLCDAERRTGIGQFLLASTFDVAATGFTVAVLALLASKMRDPCRPFVGFSLQHGVGCDLAALHGEDLHVHKSVRQLHAKRIKLRSRQSWSQI